MSMKRKLSIIITVICSIVTSIGSAQEIVLPNKPATIISTYPGFITINELTAGFGIGGTSVPYSRIFIGFTTINGYQINKNFVVAAGTGLFFYNGGQLVPLFLDLRFRFKIGQITPYFFTDGGGLLNFSDINSSRLFVNPGIGLRYSLSPNVAINFGGGLFIQQAPPNRDSFINIKAGITYKF